MAKAAAQSNAHPDALILGRHPCAYLAAAMLRQNSGVRVMLASVPTAAEALDRLVLINPDVFDLHSSLAPLKRKLDLTNLYGLSFLSDDPQTHSAFVSKSAVLHVASLKQITAAMRKLAEQSDVQIVQNESLEVLRVHDDGVELAIDDKSMRPKLLIIADEMPAIARRVLGLPMSWDQDVLHRYTYLKCKLPKQMNLGNKPLLPMSLDLKGQLTWAWLLVGKEHIQYAVEQPLDQVTSNPAQQLLQHWIQVLMNHGVIPADAAPDVAKAESMDIPFAGALSQEDVANRALLIGPAGGFYTACAEDIYPACWSAQFAADAAKRALKEKHLQDALHSYRHKWGATLGDYLRGPQQNLRFLLPLVYRNKMMTARLAEAILFGKSVVR